MKQYGAPAVEGIKVKTRGPFACLMLALAVLASACATRVSLLEWENPRFAEAAPDSFDVELATTKGNIVVRVRRNWSPNGSDRFHSLVRARYFDDVALYRVIGGFVAQFGIHGDTAVARTWRTQVIPDDSVRTHNRPGTLSFARQGRNSRSTQLFFNLVDNSQGLDQSDGFGFPPIGRVIRGAEVLSELNWEYSGRVRGQLPGPHPDSILKQGNAYLRRNFPRLDYINSARIVWRSR